jgi:hypothetical protein
MMKKILIPLLAGIIFCFSCSDEDEQLLSNDIGSQLVTIGDMKVSTFYLSNERLNIDQLTDFTIKITNEETQVVYEFDGKIVELTPMLKCELYIPKDEKLPDGEYLFTFSTEDSIVLFSTQFVLGVQKEMVSSVLQEKANYSGLGGSGTKDDPYLIGFGNQSGDDLSLTMFFYTLKSDSTHAAGLYFKQTRDVSAQCQGFDLEGNGHIGASFAGNYDGGGNTIKLSYQGTNSMNYDSYIGFFSMLNDGASISNVNFDVDLRGGHNYVGTVAGFSTGDITLKDIELDGVLEGDKNVGGLIGQTAEGTVSIENIGLQLNVTANNMCAGGLVGFCDQTTVTIDKVQNKEFRFYVGANWHAGGLIGSLIGSFQINNVRLKHETAENAPELIKSTETLGSTGGLIGLARLESSSKILYSSVDLPIGGVEHVGGLIGKLEGEINSKIWLLGDTIGACTIKGTNNVGGFVGFWDDVEKGGISDLIQKATVSGTNSIGGFIGRVEIERSDIWNRVSVTNVTLAMENGVRGEQFVGGAFGYIKCDNAENHTIYLLSNSFKLNDAIIVVGDDCVGGICGAAYQCSFSGEVSFVDDATSTIANLNGKSLFSGKINQANSYATSSGGLFGYVNNCTLEKMMSDGLVYGGARIGGIVGHAESSNLSYCVRKGEPVISINIYVGGICGKVDNNTLSHNHLVNFSEIKGNWYAGGVFGIVNAKNGTIEHLVNCGVVEGKEMIGGVIAYVEAKEKGTSSEIVRVKKSVNFGAVNGLPISSSYNSLRGLGGVIGTIDKRVFVSESVNHGIVHAATKEYMGVGGVLGVAASMSGATQIKLYNCCNTNTVKIDGDENTETKMGGVVGFLYDGVSKSEKSSIYDCYNRGNVTGRCSDDNGGILGQLTGTCSEAYTCINWGDVSDGNAGVGTRSAFTNMSIDDIYYYSGSKGKGWKATSFGNSEKKNANTFDNFSFGSVWRIDSNDMNGGFPYLVNCYYQFAKMPTIQ